ncbi:hypothetical protein EOPP23_13530 [Endozoicomonas sp. OPT23]|uniref:DUF2798 domain-containing protein n=1 Tax=Endozoicomonas sp. OPT23 TaxID=2072845 RepID=UPI00129B0B73|nr:DUF2798 domain-containing protein [Endozoicomonas sp. OPT23]MRI34012.1 hypothetical protein [Endozoicomonas sp. OPT23]
MGSSNRIFGVIPKIPARYKRLVPPFLISLFMTCVVSLISTIKSLGFNSNIIEHWPMAWLLSWLIAFPVLLIVLPLVAKLTGRIVAEE